MTEKTMTLLFGLALTATAWAQTADEVIARNLEARGGRERIQAVGAARFTGTLSLATGTEAPFVLEWKRPDRLRVEITVEGTSSVQAFDGSTAWRILPLFGRPEAEEMAPEERQSFQQMAINAFEGPLFDYAEKGSRVEYLGREGIEGTSAHKLEVTDANGDATYIYLDAESYLEIRTEAERTVQGQSARFVTTVGDYREVGGLLFAHSIEQRLEGAPQAQTFHIEKIELGVELPDQRFSMPEAQEPEGEARQAPGS